MGRLLPGTLLLAAALLGCGDRQPYVTLPRLERGLVVVLPGIEGRGPINEAICRGLDEGGVKWAIELWDWTTPLAYFANLRDEAGNRRKADELVSRIVRYQMGYPGRPVVLIGQSGGGGFATWVLEALPEPTRVKGAILLAAALSGEYMLDRALARAEEGIISFYSERDWFLLGVGTTISGTMDGKHAESAGKVGFRVPTDGARAELYRKLYQVAWLPDMAETGHTGRHITTGSAAFVATYVAPFVLAKRWDEQLVAEVLLRNSAPRPGPVP